MIVTLSLPSTSKNQYLSAKHVSRTTEYWGYMGSTQSISRTIQPIAVKLSQNVANIYITFIWTNNNKNSHVTVGGHFGSLIENMKNANKPLFHAKKIKHPSTPSTKHRNLFWYYIVSSEINQNIAVEGLNASCMSFPLTCFRFWRTRFLLTLQIFL